MGKKTALAVSLALAVGASGGYWFAQQPGTTPMAASAAPSERKPLFYRNPMNPAITSPVPAKDEMGMDYIPVYAEEDAGSKEPAGTVKIDPTIVQNIGVRTALVERQDIARTIRAVGRIAHDEERLTRLHPKTEGWVERLHIDKTGESVKKGAILLDLYSPQLVTSQQEYLIALRNLEALKDSPYPDIRKAAEDLVKSARERLEFLDVPAHQIRELERTGQVKKALHLHSPADGVVLQLGAREGQYITPQTELYSLADLSRVWVFADVYEYELPWVKVGDAAEMRLAALPERRFTGRITYIYPYMESKTRTAKVRLEFDNPGLALKPDMYADITIKAGEQPAAVVVPAEAIVRSGNREQVFVQRAPGKFEPRAVELGVSAEGKVQILAGLAPGERVVTSAQFLIDSESKLREATAKLLESARSEAKPGDAAAMDDLDMSDMSLEPDVSGPVNGRTESAAEAPDDLDMGDMTLESLATGHSGHDQGARP